MSIDYSSLGRAITKLEKSLRFAASDAAIADPDLFEELRNSAVQSFEFTYELSYKMLKRYLESVAATPDELDLSTFQNLIRSGSEMGLLKTGWDHWKAFRQARTDSSHTYDADKAESVYEIAPQFLEEARYLYSQLMEKSQSE